MYEEFDDELSEQLRERLEIEAYEQSISREIKQDVHEYKKKTTKFMDKVKTAFFVYLIAKKGVELYNKRVSAAPPPNSHGVPARIRPHGGILYPQW